MDNIKDIIERSGNNFQFQVIDFLKEKKWPVLISPYYNDNITDKPREIDIIAEKSFDVTRGPVEFGTPLGVLCVQLFIECKYINKEVVFWFDSKDKVKAARLITSNTPLMPPDTDFLIERHHYFKDEPVAKLFASGADKTQENELIYKAINQSLNAMVYYDNYGRIMVTNKTVLCTIRYPLIVCNNFNNFHKVDKSNPDGHSSIDNNFQLEVNYAHLDMKKESRQKYSLIDVIDFTQFDGFLSDLEKQDIKIVKQALVQKHEEREDQRRENESQESE